MAASSRQVVCHAQPTMNRFGCSGRVDVANDDFSVWEKQPLREEFDLSVAKTADARSLVCAAHKPENSVMPEFVFDTNFRVKAFHLGKRQLCHKFHAPPSVVM